MRKIFLRSIMVGGVLVSLVLPSLLLAKTPVNPLAKPVWYKYGINPWSKDTDNDGFADVWEVNSGYCPTFPGILPLTDKECKKGSFDLQKQVYTPPKNVSFFPARQLFTAASCRALQNTLMLPVRTPQPVDSTARGVSVYGADDPALIKVDAKAVYVLSGQQVKIISLGSEAKILSTLTLSTSSHYRADRLYLYGSTLATVGALRVEEKNGASTEHTRLELWDVKNTSDPQRIRTIDVAGSVRGVHGADGMIYMALLEQASQDDAALFATTSSLPKMLKGMWFYRDLRSRVAITTLLPWKTISGCTDVSYAVPVRGQGVVELVAVSLKYPLSAVTSKTLYGISPFDSLHFVGNAIYSVSPDFNYSWLSATAEERTELQRFNVIKNRIVWTGSQTVPGTVVPGALSEYQGKVRVVTTKYRSPLLTEQNNSINSIYVLDADLTRLVWAEGFAPYEQAIEAIPAGNKLYVRTDHEEKGFLIFGHGDYFTPQLLGRVQTPGSLVIKPFLTDTLLTLGKNSAIVPVTVGVRTSVATSTATATTTFQLVPTTTYQGFDGVKLSVVNAIYPNNAYELPVVIGDRGSQSYALENTTALALDAAKKYVAFPMVEVTWPGLRMASTTPFSVIHTVATPTTEPVVTSGVYIFSVSADYEPKFVGSVRHARLLATDVAEPVYGAVFNQGFLYTVSYGQLLVTAVPSAQTVQTIRW
jgi:hypothetical protein